MSFFGSLSARVNRTIAWADRVQRRHGVLGFPYAVIKKYGDDDGGREAALITYYGFLSIFPLLLLGVAVLSRVLADNPELRQRLITAIVPPALRSTVENSVTTLPTSTVPFIVGLIGLLFSGTGVVFSAYQTLNHVAAVPRRLRAGFASRYVRVFVMLAALCWGHWRSGRSLWWSRRCPACRERNALRRHSGRPWSSSPSCCLAPGCC
jgi:membrane protein